MDEFLKELIDNGIDDRTVDTSSIKGALSGSAIDQTKEKTYYRSKNFEQYGVLLICEDSGNSIEKVMSKLNEEIQNYAELKKYGFDVPEMSDRAFIATYKSGVSCHRAAFFVVEHIEGSNPFKLTQPDNIFKYIKKLVDPTQKQATKTAWEQLRQAAQSKCPMDLQVIISKNGRIVTIDPEKVGLPKNLPAFLEN